MGGSLVTHLQHVEQRRLSGIVETEEQQLGVLVEQAERREDVVDCERTHIRVSQLARGEDSGSKTYTS